ncbi:GNAT family N-acetyltransferase [uncultured Alistipes sp.]
MARTALQGPTVRLRAVEPDDVEIMYLWENDPEVWRVSGTLAPFSRHALMKFVEEQHSDVYLTRQLRLIIENPEGKAAGTLDLFELDPLNRRAGVGILVYD